MFQIISKTIIIYLILTITVRIMGKRQLGEMQVSELISTFLLSEIAVIPISDDQFPLIYSVISVLIILGFELIIPFLTTKSRNFKKLVDGAPSYIIFNGIINQSEIKRNRVTIDEILAQLREQGVTNTDDVECAVLETSGKMSVFQLSQKDDVYYPIVLDGEINYSNLEVLNLTKDWLNKQVLQSNMPLENIFMLSSNVKGDCKIIIKDKGMS